MNEETTYIEKYHIFHDLSFNWLEDDLNYPSIVEDLTIMKAIKRKKKANKNEIQLKVHQNDEKFSDVLINWIQFLIKCCST